MISQDRLDFYRICLDSLKDEFKRNNLNVGIDHQRLEKRLIDPSNLSWSELPQRELKYLRKSILQYFISILRTNDSSSNYEYFHDQYIYLGNLIGETNDHMAEIVNAISD